LLSSIEEKVMDASVPVGSCIDESDPCHMKGQAFQSLPSGKAHSLAAWTDLNTRMKEQGRPERDYSAIVELLLSHQSNCTKFLSVEEAMTLAEAAFLPA
jgi:hypothetical protein